jgi:glyoxylase-like metal-dependent hydrolase (beta-lactamase superfamily II)
MLRQVAEGVLVHTSEFMQSNAMVVQGSAGVLLIDVGITADEIAGIARELGDTVVAGFSTHPHWDHLLWHASLGTAPRYGTAAAAAAIAARLSTAGWEAMVSGMIPEDIVDQAPLDDQFGRITGLPTATTRIPWDGPEVRIIEHQAHAFGHAALLIPSLGVLVAGDMLSDVLIPMLNPFAPDPIGDYLVALQLLEDAAADADVIIPGHGSVGDAAGLRTRIAMDRAYLDSLRVGRTPDDPRLAPAAEYGEAMTSVHDGQTARLS